MDSKEPLAEEVKKRIQENEAQLARMESEVSSLRFRIAEREKELACHMILSNLLDELTLSSCATSSVLSSVVSILPPAFQYPGITAARIVTNTSAVFATPNFRQTPWTLTVDIATTFPSEKRVVGRLEVVYLEQRPTVDIGPFMNEELNLLTVVAERTGKFIAQKLVEERVSRLTGATQICSCCRSIRDAGDWKSIEMFLREHTSMELAPTLCPSCASTIYQSTIEQQRRQEYLLAPFAPLQAAPSATGSGAPPSASSTSASSFDR